MSSQNLLINYLVFIFIAHHTATQFPSLQVEFSRDGQSQPPVTQASDVDEYLTEPKARAQLKWAAITSYWCCWEWSLHEISNDQSRLFCHCKLSWNQSVSILTQLKGKWDINKLSRASLHFIITFWLYKIQKQNFPEDSGFAWVSNYRCNWSMFLSNKSF